MSRQENTIDAEISDVVHHKLTLRMCREGADLLFPFVLVPEIVAIE